MAVRVDKWLWSVRVFKTRSAANDACASGRVRVNGEIAKPATKLTVGDTLEIRRRDDLRVLEVVALLDKRVSASLAAEAIIDRSPPPVEQPADPIGDMIAVAGRRERGAGRPTKKDRRQMDKMRGER